MDVDIEDEWFTRCRKPKQEETRSVHHIGIILGSFMCGYSSSSLQTHERAEIFWVSKDPPRLGGVLIIRKTIQFSVL